MASAQPFVLRWGIISTGRISAAFVKVSGHRHQTDFILLITEARTGRPRRSQDVGKSALGHASCSLTCSCSRDVHDVVHKVTAVGSRSVHSAVQFIAEHANGDPSIKAHGSYAEVYADNVSG